MSDCVVVSCVWVTVSPSHPHPLTLTLTPLTQLTLSLNSPSHSTHPLLLSLNSPSPPLTPSPSPLSLNSPSPPLNLPHQWYTELCRRSSGCPRWIPHEARNLLSPAHHAQQTLCPATYQCQPSGIKRCGLVYSSFRLHAHMH